MDIEQLAGTKLGNYEIESLLGRGGMGVVYKALQLSLNRHVAVKILPPALSNDPSFATRFQREAQALAQLQHRNIVHVYDVGKEEDLHFFSMEYIDGKTLDEVLKEKGRLDSDEAVRIISQAAQGIEDAHRKGIIHRDIKPSNIILDKFGNVKVMDFGLARITADQSRPTKSGDLLGTLDYMSPEQCRGEDLDERTDIYSLGVVLYEMLTGKRPFDAPNEAALIHKIISGLFPIVTYHAQDIPRDLASAVLKAMANYKKHRFSNISEFLSEILNPSYASTSFVPNVDRASPSIAVLPFVNMSTDTAQDYFCDGLAEELINALAQLEDLRVIARTSAFSFKGKGVKIDDIGKALGVSTVLEGSVRKADNRIRVTAQLVDTTDSHHLWSERYDFEIGDVFAIQDEITLAIVDKLTPRLLGDHKARIAGRRAVEPEVYNLYLRGRRKWSKRTAESLEIAVEYFEQAIARNPEYAPAYAGLGDSYIGLALYGAVAPGEVIPKAKENAIRALEEYFEEASPSWTDRFRKRGSGRKTPHQQAQEYIFEYGTLFADEAILRGETGMYDCHALFPVLGTMRPTDAFPRAGKAIMKALEIDSDLADAHASLGIIKEFYEWDWESAEKEFRRAIELAPGNAYLHLRFAMFLMRDASFVEALEEIRRALELDPLSLATNAFEGLILYYARQYDRAAIALHKTIKMNPKFPLAHGYLGGVYAQQQRYKDALAEYTKEKDINQGLSMLFEILMATVYARMGKPNRARDLLHMLGEKTKKIYVPPYWSALLCFAIGEIDHGFEWLDESYEQRDLWLCQIKVAPEFDSVRSDPRFLALLKKMGPEKTGATILHKDTSTLWNRVTRLLTKPLPFSKPKK